MKKSLGIILAVLLVAAFSAPAMGATLSVSGKYVGEIWYNDGTIYSKNPATYDSATGTFLAGAEGVNLLRFSTLYLNIDFAEGELMSAHVPLVLYADTAGNVKVKQASDNYSFVFKGAPLVLSLTDATEGDYFFASFGDPLSLVKYIDPDADEGYATFKAAGQPFGLGFTSYFIAQDPKDTTYPRYALGRVTYGLGSGHTLGAIYAARDDGDAEMTVNIEGDITGPLPLPGEGTFTAALALSKTQSDGVWTSPVNAFELNLAGIQAGNFTLAGNVRAVDPEFEIVAMGPEDEEGDAFAFRGKRQLQGEAVTNINLAGQDVTLKVGDDYRIAYDGTINDSSTNKVYAEGEFKPSEPVTVTVGGYYQDWLTTAAPKNGDFKKNVYGEAEYAPDENLEVTAGAQWMGATTDAVAGSGFKLDGSATVKPVPGVLIEGSADYQSGTYDFIGGAGVIAAADTRLDAEAYAEAKQTFVAAGIKQVDTVLAGLARGIRLSSGAAETTYIGYAEANFAISDLFSDKVAVLTGKSEEDDTDAVGTFLYNKFTYYVSSNSTFALGYTWKDSAGTLDASYTVTLGTSTIKLSYGKTGLDSDACTLDFDEDRPWAWLCNAAIAPDTDLYKLTVTIPF